jgi:hypothetical protein
LESAPTGGFAVHLWLADDLFLVALDDRTGRSALHPKALGLGLAGALLSELVLCGNISVNGQQVQVINPNPPGPLGATVLAHMIAEPQHPLRIWLEFLAQDAMDAVGERVTRGGLVERRENRVLLRTTVTYRPVDPAVVAWRPMRLEQMLVRRQEISLPDAVLLGLVSATGLTRRVMWDGSPEDFDYLRALVAALPPPLADIVSDVESLVAQAVLTKLR